MTFKAVIFDLDGTLYDKSRLGLYLVGNQFLQGRMALSGRERMLRKKLKGRFFGSEEAFHQAFFGALGGEKARKWYYNTYMPAMTSIMRKHYHLYPWVEETFKTLRNQGIKTAVFSDYSCTNERLEALGFDLSWTDFVFEAPAFGGLKPCKEAFEALCQAIGEQPSDCLMVGDRLDTDGAGAASVGMGFVLVKDDEKQTKEFMEFIRLNVKTG